MKSKTAAELKLLSFWICPWWDSRDGEVGTTLSSQFAKRREGLHPVVPGASGLDHTRGRRTSLPDCPLLSLPSAPRSFRSRYRSVRKRLLTSVDLPRPDSPERREDTGTKSEGLPAHWVPGHSVQVHKLLIVVELLLGEIPDRLQFRQPSLKRSLMPYFLLIQAVRTGNLAKFNQVLDQFGETFQADGTYTLIIQLWHNVIKTGVRIISLSYSQISLADIAQKLQLDSPEDAEFIVAKAFRDGVIEASINHEKGYVQSKEMIDIYSTREPQLAFHQRISFCLDIHMSVKAMRFPPKSTTRTWSLQRNGVSENSRTWSLPRRWQKMMMTASLELGGWGGVR
uniref:26S proteasome non-ATPase regulatory subunit 3-like n=1 Tax=Callithrix jacchus TaxID=9483 RepID=UPI0023DD238F|nr:26S proteasome non-ATPase regulatory subunit 3-like [Callithrix jacchus]